MRTNSGSSIVRLSMLVAVAAGGLAACADEQTSDGRDPPSVPSSDVEFIDELVPHHQDAIAMADHVIARGSDPEVKAMAEQMKAAQQEEIALMQDARNQLSGRAQPPVVPDPHSEADMAMMEDLAGIELDRMFLRDMIPHHAGAVVVSHRALPNLERDDLRELAEMTIVVQTREMNEMLDKLETLPE